MAAQSTHLLDNSANTHTYPTALSPQPCPPPKETNPATLWPPSSNHIDELRGLAGQYLADAFIVWDYYRDEALPHTPLLLRFEEYDVIVLAESTGELSFWKGGSNTQNDLQESLVSLPPKIKRAEICLGWTGTPSLTKAIGQQVQAVRITNKREKVLIHLETVDIVLAGHKGSVHVTLEGRPVNLLTGKQDIPGTL